MRTPTAEPGLQERKLLAVCLCLGLVHHYFFYDKSWGISYPLFVAVFYTVLYSFSGERWSSWKDPEAILLVPIVLLSLTYATQTNMLFVVLNGLAVPLLILLQTACRRGLRPKEPLLLRVIDQLFVQTVLYLPRPVVLAVQILSGGRSSKRMKTVMKVCLGLIISIPLLLAVGGLLASADTMFDRSLSRLPDILGDLNAGTAFMRGLWIVFITIAAFAYLAGLLQPKAVPLGPSAAIRDLPQSQGGEGAHGTVTHGPGDRTAAAGGRGEGAEAGRTGESSGLQRPGLDPTVASTVLLVLNAVYLLFAFVQFSYFFGGGASALPEGVTYASYARKGFAELVIVTMINLTVLITFVYGVRRPQAGALLFLRALLAVLVGCTGIMLSSAYLRLSMYEEAYGYTVTRLLVHAFMIFLLALFILALAKLWRERLPLMRCYAITAAAAYVLINYMGIDGMIARNNIARFETSGVLDSGYLSGLSYEAVPYVLELQERHPELQQAKDALQVFRGSLENERKMTSWTEFNFSKERARRMLEELQP